MHYPHGDGGPDRYMAELYDLQNDPGELRNLIKDPAHAASLADLRRELERLMGDTGLSAATDRMPLDAGIKTELPDAKVR
jgi:arylsulfatase A-like enzyme